MAVAGGSRRFLPWPLGLGHLPPRAFQNCRLRANTGMPTPKPTQEPTPSAICRRGEHREREGVKRRR